MPHENMSALSWLLSLGHKHRGTFSGYVSISRGVRGWGELIPSLSVSLIAQANPDTDTRVTRVKGSPPNEPIGMKIFQRECSPYIFITSVRFLFRVAFGRWQKFTLFFVCGSERPCSDHWRVEISLGHLHTYLYSERAFDVCLNFVVSQRYLFPHTLYSFYRWHVYSINKDKSRVEFTMCNI